MISVFQIVLSRYRMKLAVNAVCVTDLLPLNRIRALALVSQGKMVKFLKLLQIYIRTPIL